MKIRSVKIENWRNIHRLELAFEGPITVVHGPNEVGKSTVLEALRHAMLADASSTARELSELVPWGSSAKAHVELSLVTGRGERLRIEKSFPKGDARLFLETEASPESSQGRRAGEREGAGHESLLAEGRAVQPKIFEYLGVPAEAADLFDLLWIGQGESLALFGGKPDEGPVKGAAQTLVKSIIKENLLSGRAEEFYRQLKEEWGSIYQKSGRPRKGSRIGDLELREADLRRQAAAAEAEIARTEAKAGELEEMEGTIGRLEGERGRAQNRLSLLEGKQEAGASLQPKIADLERLEEGQRRLIAVEAAEREVAASLPGAWGRKSDALIAWIAALEERRSRAEELRERVEQKAAAVASAKVTERKQLEELEESRRIVREARVRLEASGVSVAARRTGGEAIDLQVSRDEAAPERFSLTGSGRWEASRTVRLSVDSRLEIDCSGPLSREEWEKLTGEIGREEARLEARLLALGCSTVEEAKEDYDRYVRDSAEHTRLAGELASLLGPGGKGLAGELAEVQRAKEELSREGRLLEELGIAGAGSRRPEAAPSESAAARSGAKPEKRAGPAGRDETDTPGGLDDRSSRTPAELVRALTSELSVGIRDIEGGRRRREELLDGRSREEFTHELYSLKEEVGHAKTTVASMEPLDVESVGPAEVKAQRSQLDRLQAEILEAVERRSALRAELQAAGGLVEQSEGLQRELAGVERELAAERRRIDAVSLLIRLIEEEKEELDRNIVAPLQERLTAAFRSVVGERYGGVRITDRLGIEAIAVPSLERGLDIGAGALSYGTREQLSFLFRLVLAQYLSTREPQVMMLDDTFVNTDSARRELLLEMMHDETGVQFVLFTCHGEHYEAYGRGEGVTMIDLLRDLG